MTQIEMGRDSRIMVAGGSGMVGHALLRCLRALGYSNLDSPSRQELDLADLVKTEQYFSQRRPEFVFLAAGKVGGLVANRDYPADYISENLRIYANCIESAAANGCRKLLFIGSSCVYPNGSPQPIPESALLTGPFEPSLEFFGVAKIAGIKLCQAYRRQFGFDAISVMPCSLFGPYDYFDLERAHVLPALLRKFDDARRSGQKSVEVWGTGTPRREFLHVDDFARALELLMRVYSDERVINVGSGEDIRIIDLAELVREVVGFEGEIRLDPSKPDGVARKLLDISRLSEIGWKPEIPLRQGLEQTYAWMQDNLAILRA